MPQALNTAGLGRAAMRCCWVAVGEQQGDAGADVEEPGNAAVRQQENASEWQRDSTPEWQWDGAAEGQHEGAAEEHSMKGS